LITYSNLTLKEFQNTGRETLMFVEPHHWAGTDAAGRSNQTGNGEQN
jgi:hypothetical protein